MDFQNNRNFRDFLLLFLTRMIRMFSYGMLPVVFFVSLTDKSLTEMQVSWIQSGIVFGDIFVSLILTTQADRFGRVNTLMIGAALKFFTGAIYAYSDNVIVLIVSGVLGVISISGGEIGPFMPIEQSVLTQLTEASTVNRSDVPANISKLFGYYNMAGYISQAAGALFAGLYVVSAQKFFEQSRPEANQQILLIFAFLGLVKFVGYFMMRRDQVQPNVAMEKRVLNCTGVHKKNIRTIVTLSVLFALDAFAGGFVVQSFISFYYQKKYDVDLDNIGAILFVCNIISGISGVVSSIFVKKCGAMATMIYTHLPSNVLLLAIAFTDVPFLSVGLLFARFCISQMDVPARQTYVSMVVSSQERSAANGITNIARSVGLCLGLGLTGNFISKQPDDFLFSFPFLVAGVLKIVYDVTIGCCFLWSKRQTEVEKQQIFQGQEMSNQVSNSAIETPSEKNEIIA